MEGRCGFDQPGLAVRSLKAHQSPSPEAQAYQRSPGVISKGSVFDGSLGALEAKRLISHLQEKEKGIVSGSLRRTRREG